MKRALAFGWLALLALVPRDSIAAATPASWPERTAITGAGNSFGPVFSGDGNSIAFVSAANNLVTNDDLGAWLDVFVRSLTTSNTVLVSVNTNGVGGGDGDSILPTVSSNGMVIAFESTAGNLTPGDTNGFSDIFVRNLASGTTRLVSSSTNGTTSANGRSFSPLLSADGRYVIFESAASNLVTNDFNGTNDIFIHDLVAGTTALVSVNARGTASADGPSCAPSISSNGLFVAFVSRATNLVAGVTNRLGEIYVRDLAAGSNVWAMASHISATHEISAAIGPYRPSEPVLSADGRFVAFKTSSGAVVRFDTHRPTNLVVETFGFNVSYYYDNPRLVKLYTNVSAVSLTPNGRYACLVAGTNALSESPNSARVVRVDFETLTLCRVEFCCPGGTGNRYTTNYCPEVAVVCTNHLISASASPLQSFLAAAPAMSADGQRIAFLNGSALPQSTSSLGLPLGLYARDMGTNMSILIASNLAGQAGFDLSGLALSMAMDGSRVAWESFNGSVVSDDLNLASDVFVATLPDTAVEAVSVRHPACPAVTAPMRSQLNPESLSADGRWLAFTALGPLLGRDTNRAMDAFLHDAAAGTNSLLSGGFTMRNYPGVFGILGPDTNVFSARISADGRFALLAAGEPNVNATGSTNLFRRAVGATNGGDLVTFGLLNSFAPVVESPTISRDGLLVAFSTAQQIVAPTQPPAADVNNLSDIVVRDYGAFLTNPPINVVPVNLLVSVSMSGFTTANGASIHPIISPDNQRVAFLSRASDLTPDSVSNATFQLFVRELLTNRTRLVSFSTAPSPALSGRSVERPSPGGATNAVFGGGRYLFFQNGASNLIYRHDLRAGYVETVTPHPEGSLTYYFTNYARFTNALLCADCANPSVSAEGRWLAYETRRAGNPVNDVFVLDLVTGSNELASVNAAGGGGGNGSSFGPLLSYDARFVVFSSRASNLTAGDTNGAADIFVRDRWRGVTHCLSQNALGSGTGNRVSSAPVLSGDGRTVAFQSFANDLVPGDYNDTRDVFLVTLRGPDSDGDGMDDDWESIYFNTLARDGAGDFDGDGTRDGAEFLAGTDPTNQGSVFQVLTLTTTRPAPFGPPFRYSMLTWTATPGRSYRVQHQSGVGSTWTDVPGDVVAVSTTATKTELITDGSATRIYRVVLLP